MKLLVIGSGGREHAIVHALARSPRASRIYAAPGNGGMREEAECVTIAADDIGGLAAFAESHAIDLTVVGPEVPLSLGVVDRFAERDLPIVGPTAEAARLESSKAFTKRLCGRKGIPSAAYAECASLDEAYRALETFPAPVVVKADGLAAGKGVVVAETVEEARRAVENFMSEKTLGAAGSRLVIEEYLSGEEMSFHVFADGSDFRPTVASQDHKRRFEDDRGPNTGGMGAYSVDGLLPDTLREQVIETIIRPTLEEVPGFSGVLYAGLMLTAEGPKLLEYNVRLGDPETQVILPRLDGDFLDIMAAIPDRRLGETAVGWHGGATATVVLVDRGYPGKVRKGQEISGLEEAQKVADVVVYHAGTRWEDGRVYTAGGRVLNVAARGATLSEALEKAYFVAEMIDFENKSYRRDIGRRRMGKAR